MCLSLASLSSLMSCNTLAYWLHSNDSKKIKRCQFGLTCLQVRVNVSIQAMGLHHPLDGVTNPEYKLLPFIQLTKFFCKEKKALAFNWDRRCHLMLRLRFILFHCLHFFKSCCSILQSDWTILHLRSKYSIILQLYKSFGGREKKNWSNFAFVTSTGSLFFWSKSIWPKDIRGRIHNTYFSL